MACVSHEMFGNINYPHRKGAAINIHSRLSHCFIVSMRCFILLNFFIAVSPSVVRWWNLHFLQISQVIYAAHNSRTTANVWNCWASVVKEKNKSPTIVSPGHHMLWFWSVMPKWSGMKGRQAAQYIIKNMDFRWSRLVLNFCPLLSSLCA